MSNRLIEIFHEIFSMLLFAQCTQAALTLAITIVSMTTSQFDSSVLIGKLVYVVLQLGQNGLFCYLSNEIYYEVISTIQTIFQI